MRKNSILIGRDTKTDCAVYVTSQGGHLRMESNVESWQGMHHLVQYADPAKAEAHAWRIAADPLRELAALGMDASAWLAPDSQRPA